MRFLSELKNSPPLYFGGPSTLVDSVFVRKLKKGTVKGQQQGGEENKKEEGDSKKGQGCSGTERTEALLCRRHLTAASLLLYIC